MHLLVTRPAGDASKTAARLEALGHEAIVAPLLDFVPMPLEGPEERPAALAFTSANAVTALESAPAVRDWRELPVFCVGERTAAAARAAGYGDVRASEGGAVELARLVSASLSPSAGTVLYPAAQDRSGDLEAELAAAGRKVRLVEIYRMEPVGELPSAAATALAEGQVDGVLLYSRRTAEIFARLATAAGLRPVIEATPCYVLAPAIAAGLPFGRVVAAAAPNEDALLAALPAVGEHRPQASVEGLGYSQPEEHAGRGDMADAEDTRRGTEGKAAGRRKRPPVTIDLEAEAVNEMPRESAPAEAAAAEPETPTVTVDAPASDTPSEAASPASPETDAAPAYEPESTTANPESAASEAIDRRRAGLARYLPVLVAAVLGGIAGGLITAFLVAPPTDTVKDATVDSRFEALDARVARVEAAVKEMPAASATTAAASPDLSALESRVAAIESRPAAAASPVDLTAIEAKIGGLQARLDQLQPSASGDTAAVDAKLGELQSKIDQISVPPPVDLTPLQTRLDGLQQRLDQLEAHPPSDPKTEAAAETIALTSLRQAAVAGGSFAAELAAYQKLGGKGAALQPFAKDGAPSLAALEAAVPPLADRIRVASAKADPNASMLDRLAASAGALIQVKPAGPIEGSSAVAVLSRMEAAVTRGDLAAALREAEGLDASEREILSGWLEGARNRVAIDAALAALPPAGSDG